MTEPGAPLDRTPGTILPRLIERYGLVLFQDRERLEGLLRDECGTAHRREISLLVAAAEAGVPEAIKTRSANVGWNIARPELASRLSADRGLATDAGLWAVDTWAAALGVRRQPVQEKPGDKAEPSPLIHHAARDVRFGSYVAVGWGVVMIWMTSNNAAGGTPGAALLSSVVIAAIAGTVAWGISRRDRTAAGVFLALTAIGALADLLPPKLPEMIIDLVLVYIAFRTARVIFGWQPRRLSTG